MRDGQSININNPLSTFTGKQGRLVVRFRIEWADAGNGYTAGNGTWKVVSGTGAYARLTGARPQRACLGASRISPVAGQKASSARNPAEDIMSLSDNIGIDRSPRTLRIDDNSSP